jgi:predicted metalloendopeptidase
LSRTEIPSTHQGVGSFQTLDDDNEGNLWRLLENAARGADGKSGANAERLGLFYGTCMDSDRARPRGLAPLEPALKRLDAIRTPADLAGEVARLHSQGVPAVFRFFAAPDLQEQPHDDRELPRRAGSGSRTATTTSRTDSASVRIRAQYVAHIGRMAELLGRSGAAGPQGRRARDGDRDRARPRVR